jgi:RHS repeat-associated protein
MRNKAARKGTFSSLAALAFSEHDHSPHPTSPSSSLKLATGLSTFSIRSNILVSTRLAAKTRWSVVYSYRARWYLPETGVFAERDPMGYSAGPDAFGFLSANTYNVIDPLGLYEKDFHFYAVYFLARAAGFSSAQSKMLAWASQYVDDCALTSPDDLSQFVKHYRRSTLTLRAFHFLSPRRGLTPVRRANGIAFLNLRRAKGTHTLIALGMALHSWADTYAHEGFVGVHSDEINMRTGSARPNIGHADASEHGHFPDRPYHNVRKALAAAKSVFQVLRSAATERGLAQTDSWNTIRPHLEQLFRFQAPLDRRVRRWQAFVRGWFHESIDYDRMKVPSTWIGVFTGRAKEQRRFVLGLEGLGDLDPSSVPADGSIEVTAHPDVILHSVF